MSITNSSFAVLLLIFRFCVDVCIKTYYSWDSETKVNFQRKANKYLEIIENRDRLLSMYINSLIGYLVVEVSIVGGFFSGIIPIHLSTIIIISSLIDFFLVSVILLLWKKRGVSDLLFFSIFYFGILIYLISLFFTTYHLIDFRFINLIFAIIAITIVLPFTTFFENMMLSLFSFFSYIAATYLSIHNSNQGSFFTESFYLICALPIFFILTMISRQINEQKEYIRSGNLSLSQTNEQLIQVNKNLEREYRSTSYEINLASHVQKSFLNDPPADLNDWDIALYFKPLYGVSGDFYDFYVKDGKLRGISVFDVSGHGLSSALYTMLLKPTMYRLFSKMTKSSLNKILSKLNDSIVSEFSEVDNFITGIILRFDGNNIEYVNAGHPELLLRRKTKTIESVESLGEDIKGEPIGLSRYYTYKTLRFPVNSGDVLLLFTDCLIEGNTDSTPFGYDRLRRTLFEAGNESAQSILETLISNFFAHTGSILSDDLTVIVAVKK